jgi:DNA invertase Pin-like site-specific DNA recombinase
VNALSNPVGAPKIAVTYRRISKDDEGDELGIQRQHDALFAYAEQRGWVIGQDFFDNDISASNRKHRPGYQNLMRAIEAGEADVVLCTEVDRLTRHPRELEDLVDTVEAHRVQIVALRAGELDLSTSGGRMVARMLGAAARREVEAMSERQQARIAQRAKSGLSHGGGARPFGFRRPKRDETHEVNGQQVPYRAGELIVIPEEEAIIRDLAERLIAGASLRSVTADLNRRGLTTSTGSPWRESTVRKMMRSPRIAGLVPLGGEAVATATWPAILDRTTWERVVARLDTVPQGRQPRTYLLAGMMRCGECGRKLRSVSRVVDGGKMRRTYRCVPEPGIVCAGVSVGAELAEGVVIADVLAAAEDADLAMVRARRDVSEQARLTHEVADDEGLLSDLATQLAARRMTRGEWAAAQSVIFDRLQANRTKLRAIGGGDTLPKDLVKVAPADWERLTFQQKRDLLDLFIEEVTVYKPKITAHWNPERVKITRWRTSWSA